MNRFKQIYYFLKHFITARNTKGYAVHSPYLFHFTRFILMEKLPFYAFAGIENERRKLLKDKRRINKSDFGTGKSRTFKVRQIASKSLCSPRKAALLYRIVNNLNLNNILELGTSLGISSAYLAASSTERKCISLEGCEETISIAKQVHANLGINNVSIIKGEINKTISIALNELSTVDFVLMDANHTYEATLHYFEKIMPFLSKNAVVVIDDIYWSDGMLRAWNEIIAKNEITASIDLFHFGVLFFNPDLHKKNYKMRFI